MAKLEGSRSKSQREITGRRYKVEMKMRSNLLFGHPYWALLFSTSATSMGINFSKFIEIHFLADRQALTFYQSLVPATIGVNHMNSLSIIPICPERFAKSLMPIVSLTQPSSFYPGIGLAQSHFISCS